MIARFICKHCHQEVESEVYKNLDFIGYYAECPECEGENQVAVEEEVIGELDTFPEEGEDEKMQGDLVN